MSIDPTDFSVEVASDKIEATLTLLNEIEDPKFTTNDLHALLQEKGIRYGVDEEQLKKIAANPACKVPYVVARGTLPQDGKNEEIEYKFPVDEQTRFEETEGAVDFRNIQNFNNTRKDTLLAIRHPAEPGTPGSSVLGDELKAKDGKKALFRVGKGARLSDDELSAIAEVDGHACLVNDRISVMHTVEVPSSVDYSVGNIHFVGNVRIRGGVMPDFCVETEGDLEITESVEKAIITCGGNFELHGIVFGQGKCCIEVGGDANIGAVDQAELKVRGSLTVRNYIRHSQVSVGGYAKVEGDKGNVIGGSLSAFRGIMTPVAGNNMATLTKLSVGINPFVADEIGETQKHQDALELKLKQFNTAISRLVEMQQSKGQLDASNRAMLEKLQLMKQQLEPEYKQVLENMKNFEGRSPEFADARIRVSNKIYPGVVLSFRDSLQYKTMDEAQNVSFYEEEGEIRTGPY